MSADCWKRAPYPSLIPDLHLSMNRASSASLDVSKVRAPSAAGSATRRGPKLGERGRARQEPTGVRSDMPVRLVGADLVGGFEDRAEPGVLEADVASSVRSDAPGSIGARAGQEPAPGLARATPATASCPSRRTRSRRPTGYRPRIPRSSVSISCWVPSTRSSRLSIVPRRSPCSESSSKTSSTSWRSCRTTQCPPGPVDILGILVRGASHSPSAGVGRGAPEGRGP